ncbi:MAG: response regulator [Acidobacteriaceae bacterium]
MLGQTQFLAAEPPQPPGSEPARFSARTGRELVRILVVDDEHLITDTICAILNQHGFQAIPAYSAADALESARDRSPDIVLSDVLMPGMSGVELGIALRREFPEVKIFLFSGQAATSEMIHRAEADGHRFELFPKPIHPDELIARLRRACAS